MKSTGFQFYRMITDISIDGVKDQSIIISTLHLTLTLRYQVWQTALWRTDFQHLKKPLKPEAVFKKKEEEEDSHTHTLMYNTGVHTHKYTYLLMQSHDLQSLLPLSSHSVQRSRERTPNELNRWVCVQCVCVCMCVSTNIEMRTSARACVCFKMLEMKISPAAELLTVIHALLHTCTSACTCAHTHTQTSRQTDRRTNTHSHLPLLKRHIHWIYCVLSCCLLWMGTAAHLQWIVNPAEHSAVRVLWIANMLYLALPIPLYLPPITPIVSGAKKREDESKRKLTLLKGNKI